MQGGGRKSWVLFERPLLEGILERFYVYVHSVAPGRVVQSSVELKLQIWREVPLVANSYRLLYERAFNVDHSTDTGIYYVVSIRCCLYWWICAAACAVYMLYVLATSCLCWLRTVCAGYELSVLAKNCVCLLSVR